jgi:iron complex outermembrane receptor protein
MLESLMSERESTLFKPVAAFVAAALGASAFSVQAQESTDPIVVADAGGPADAEVMTAEDGGGAGGGPAEVTITGSRVARSGYDMPTPVSVIGEAEIAAAAPSNLADFVNDIPSIVGSTTPATGNAAISSGAAGINALNLRGLGTSRTLVLLDGRRSVGSTASGAVDINTFPQGLVKSVEIVTGGASAAYGSDAVSGVVNFILDKEFTGLKFNGEVGQTTYGDDESWKAMVTGGTPFADGRGHLLFNAEKVQRDGIYGVPRDWNNGGWYIITNPAYAPGNGLPQWIIGPEIGPSMMMPGGIITNTALRGYYFGKNGTVGQLAYGATRDPDMIGGDWELTQVNNTQSLHADEDREAVFARASYELTESLELFGEASWSSHQSIGWGGAQRNEGGVVIRADNAFLPEFIRDEMQRLGLTQFTMGTSNGDLSGEVGNRRTNMQREVQRYVLGLQGSFHAFSSNWKWDASIQTGITDTHEEVGTTHNARLAQAQDAVFHPDTGEIVCRSTLTNPNDGCIPFNRMGVGVNSPEAIAYVMGFPFREQRFQQDVAAVNFSTNFDNPWLDPIGFAIGAEHRKEEVSGFVPPEYQGGWFTGNYLPTFGEYDVNEAYVEAIVPLPKEFELNTAVRGTDYSTSGFVTTWKAGVTWQATDDLKFRLTRSRDIRAPNLAELFQAGQRRTNTLIDPFTGGSVQFLENTTGNLELEPEEADTLGVGIVWRPSFAPGLGLSIDYYEIDIDKAIGTVSAQDIADRCFMGNQRFCDAIVRGLNENRVEVITQLNNQPFNFEKLTARGLDVEASYRLSLDKLVSSWRGDLALRFMGTRYLEKTPDNGIDPAIDRAGENSDGGTPDFLYRIQAAYSLDRFSLTLTGRGISSGVYDKSFIVCSTDCPESTAHNRTVNMNSLAGAFYLDANLSYKFGASGNQVFFVSVTNLMNRDPVIVAQGPGGGAHIEPSTNTGLYDFLGRLFRVGVRLNFD